MAEGKSFNVVAQEVCVELEEKGSKFLAYSKFVRNEEQVQEFLTAVKQAHPQATHVCYAYVMGQNGDISRNNDDGEPAGTAGVPILEAIKKKGLTNTLIVVVRYFGGKELGTKGLYKAYFTVTLNSLDYAGLYVMKECAIYSFSFSYNEFAKASSYFRDTGLPMIKIDYLDVVKAEVAIPVVKEQLVFSDLKMLMGGNVINNKLRLAYFRFNAPNKK